MTPKTLKVVHPRRGLIAPGAALVVASGVWCSPASAPAQCSPIWSGLNGGTNWDCRRLGTFDEGISGIGRTALFIPGGFTSVGGVAANRIARWDGWRASAVGGWPAINEEFILRSGGVGIGAAVPAGLYAGGHFSRTGDGRARNLARWFPQHWHDAGGGVLMPVPSLIAVAGVVRAYDDDGPGPMPAFLFVGGRFTHAGDGVPAEGLARWDGSEWSAVGGGLTPFTGQFADVGAMEIFDDDGPGPRREALYVGGNFASAGGAFVNRVGRWDGASWEPLQNGVNGSPVQSLCVFDEDGPGPGRAALFVGGPVSASGYSNVGGLMRWDGVTWSAVWPPGLAGGPVSAMAVFDQDGSGPDKPSLFVGGFIDTLPGGGPAGKIARWDGSQWHAVGTGVAGFGIGTTVHAMAVFDEDGEGPNPGGLYVGGYFTSAGGVPTSHVARWGCPLPPECFANCNRDFHPITGAHILSVADFGCFQGKYVLNDPYADCNASGGLTVADFGCFQGKYVLGCP
ncbi:MAG: hypothetical protein ACKVU4_09205 [Phycisphaerales bacterium]